MKMEKNLSLLLKLQDLQELISKDLAIKISLIIIMLLEIILNIPKVTI
jgi:hypothetical protein